LSIARLHDNVQDLRRSQESLRQAQLLAKLGREDNKGQNREAIIKDKKETVIREVKVEKPKEEIKDTKETGVRGMSTHAVLMEHATRSGSPITSSFQMKKLSRREQILALFVRGVDVSIKDIAARIKGCSEKTIQRELNALLYDNVIERIGEKRWSRYVLR
jgi:predicted HTH transcriptional regulator